MENYMNNTRPERYLDELTQRYPTLSVCKDDILKSFEILKNTFSKGGKLLIAGNGGSCSDGEHIAGELMKGFLKRREIKQDLSLSLQKVGGELGKEIASKLQQGLPTIALSNHQSLNTAFLNDVKGGGDFVFAQQVNVFGQKGDVLLGISTSGNSQNVFNASLVAKAKGLQIVSLTGETGGKLKDISDVTIKAPSSITHHVQELHLPIYHCLCLMLEDYFFE